MCTSNVLQKTVLERCLDVVEDAYYDPSVFANARRGNEDCGDTLALFLVREIRDSIQDPDGKETAQTAADQVRNALYAIHMAAADLESAIHALDTLQDTVLNEESCDHAPR